MAALDAAHVLAGRHLFAAEAGRVGDVPDRQAAGRQDLVAIQIGHRYLSRRDQPQVVLDVTVQRFGEFGQAAGAEQALLAHHKGHVDLVVALPDMDVQHPGDQRSLQARAQSLQHVEAASRQLDAALKVDNAQCLAQFPVWSRFEVESAQRAFSAHHHVFAVVLADWYAGQRQVGNAAHRVEKLLVDNAQAVVKELDLVADAAHFRFQRFSFLAVTFAHELADTLALRIAAGLQILDLRQQMAPLFVQRQHPVHRRVGVLQRRHLLPDELRLFPNQFDVQHMCLRCHIMRIKTPHSSPGRGGARGATWVCRSVAAASAGLVTLAR